MSVYRCPWCGFYHVGHKYPKVEVVVGTQQDDQREEILSEV